MPTPSLLQRLKERKLVQWAVAYLAGAFVVGCNPVDDFACTDEAVPAIYLTTKDSITGDPVLGCIAWVRDGTFVDTLHTGGGVSLGPFERQGVYDLTVEHPKYLTWRKERIVVTGDVCHVHEVTLTARLQPSN